MKLSSWLEPWADKLLGKKVLIPICLSNATNEDE